MYLHIGSGIMVETQKIIGVFDSKGAAKDLCCERKFRRERDYSCVLTDDGAVFSELSAATLKKRAEGAFDEY
ncbi:MAG: DUF370 domain-containing protein [Acidaminococcales bacterium]|nr:DUF370 domain-containing protein [Acidaminococcales bacterium]